MSERTDPAAAGIAELHVAQAFCKLGLHGYAAQLGIDGAVKALVAGGNGSHLRELAGEHPEISAFELADLIERAIEDTGHKSIDLTEDEAGKFVARHWAARVLRGELGPRWFVSWAYSQFSVGGPEWADELVILDSDFDLYDQGFGSEPDWVGTLKRFLDSPLVQEPPRLGW